MKRQKAFTLIEVLVIIALISLLASMVLLLLKDAGNRARVAKAKAELSQIEKAIELTRYTQNKVLGEITSWCSDCPCRDDADLKSPDEACLNSVNNFFSKIGQPFLLDPWGSPYLMDENEGEDPANPCLWSGGQLRKDDLRSVGPDRKYGTGDDVRQPIPFYSDTCIPYN